MLCSREEWIKSLYDENKQLYERRSLKKLCRDGEFCPNYELHPVVDELSFEEFYLALKGLRTDLALFFADPTGPETITEKDYTLEEIEKMFLSDQW